jgi:glycosyltransferase involved in cell wall biosynthesis
MQRILNWRQISCRKGSVARDATLWRTLVLSKVKVILGVDAITWPLNGIGRYALELAGRLPVSDEIEELRYFAHGKFVSAGELKAISRGELASAASYGWRLFSEVKHGLRNSRVAAWGQMKVLPVIEKMRLKSCADYLFHSPSYLLPGHGGPAISTIHDLSVFKFPQWHPKYRVKRLNAAIGRTLSIASHVITDTEVVRREVIDYFALPEDKVTAIPLGVDKSFSVLKDSETAPLLNAFGLKPGEYSLCVSTIEPRKNIERLIRAFENLPAALQRQYPLVLVGDYGWNSGDIHRLISNAEEKGMVKYIGHVPDGALPALYSGCRAFLYPSFYEGFGLPLLEAMACGAPVLTSDCSCMPEVVGDVGMLVNPQDILSISNGIERVLTDEAWRQPATERGLARAHAMTWENTVSLTVDLYNLVWNRKS